MAAGYRVAAEVGELGPLGLAADGGGEVGILVDDDEVGGFAGLAGDLAAAGVEQHLVPVVHGALELAEYADGVVHGRADEDIGAVAPHTQLDPLAVDQDELAVEGQRAVRDEQVERGGLAAAGLAADQHVLLGQVDVDLLAVLVHAQVRRVEDGEREHRHAGRKA
jgi:hypothetical protein